MKRYIILFVLFLMVSTASEVYAAKARVPKTGAGGGGRTVGGSYSTARLSRGTNSVVVSFINLANVSKASYMLSYTGGGIAQGVVGSITPVGAIDSRDLYFGTCSHGVCTPHYNIKNARLVVTTYLKSGAKNVKLYRIKY
ncbi:hypothetical protein A2875_02385 [Candidatus Gottesmanbacteria bacterium RIFCSPHIGHO2_01_FULL_46_14]|uniref:Uncharacterized protein n=1 Tax=Candidatus Gottesmanbacteria bacterium RIFCSPHIGHO2_01_FULL_46_14 TaxID=1798380 RepID=A0A1F5ZSV9_9BACT|nr:MAG: hypothetical protein A2875_02385 [Candidatus Gottesmanbacteria bacterium RIFCSPHIGHO2_01_FULL_46_14]